METVSREIELEPVAPEETTLPATEVRYANGEHPSFFEQLRRVLNRAHRIRHMFEGVVEQDHVERAGRPGGIVERAAVGVEAALLRDRAGDGRRLDPRDIPTESSQRRADIAHAAADVQETSRSVTQERSVRPEAQECGEAEPVDSASDPCP